MANIKDLVAPSNGKGGKSNDKDLAAYKILQKQIADHLRMIDLAFKQYYLANPHFPRSHKSQFDHWTLTREKGYTRIDVFYKENMMYNDKNGHGKNGKDTTGDNYAHEKGKSKVKKMAMAAAVPEDAGSTDAGSLPQIYTYDEVGAPPSGPKDPRTKP